MRRKCTISCRDEGHYYRQCVEKWVSWANSVGRILTDGIKYLTDKLPLEICQLYIGK